MPQQQHQTRPRAPLPRRRIDEATPDFDEVLRQAAPATRRAMYRRLARDPSYLPGVRWQLPAAEEG